MKDYNIKIKFASLAGALIVGVSGIVSAITLHCYNYNKNIIKTQKPYYQIEMDAEALGADMEVALNKSKFYGLDKYIRLKMDEDKPVIVEYQEDMEQREIDIIKKVVEYYNKVFQTINENYKFEVKEDGQKIPKEYTSISFVNVDKPGRVVGESIARDDIRVGAGEWIVNKAEIQLDWEAIKDKEDAYIYGVALHEFSHAIGLGDVYINSYNQIDRSTVMHVDTWGDINHLFPNDYAILQSLYSNEYKKNSTYEDAIKTVNEKIERYTNSFYKFYAKHLQENGIATNKMQEGEIPHNITWCNFKENKGMNFYELNINGNKCEFILKDENGNCLQKSQGDVIFQDGILFLKGIVIDDASQYSHNYDFLKGKKMKLMFSIYIDKNNNLVIDNGLSKSYLNKSMLNTVKASETKR